jgi:membrane-associated HD superfamily phosphohydrolase
MNNSPARKSLRKVVFLALLALFSTGLAFAAVMLPLLSRMITPSLQVGQVADQDYRAPRPASYVSQVLTEQARQEAGASVPVVFTAPDTAIARRQMESLRAAL